MPAHTNSYRDLSIAIIVLIVLQTLLAIKVGIFDGLLGDTDVYMWLNRVLDLHAHGNWSDHTLQRIDPPYGYEQHWTRPYDFLLYGGAWLGSYFTDFRTALHVWGVLISPVLEVLALFAFIWFIRPLTNNRENGIAGLLFVTQMGIIASFVAGRADHQSLILLLFILSIGLGQRLLIGSFNRTLCYMAALIAAFAIWVSIESILFPTLTILIFSLYWLSGEAYISRKLAHYSVALVSFLIIFRLIEHESHRVWEPVADQISIFYISLFGLIALFWVLVHIVEHLTGKNIKPPYRLLSGVVWTVCIALLLEIIFPGFLSGPWGQIDELYRQVHHLKTKELQPVISSANLTSDDWLPSLLKFDLWLGIIIPGIPALIYLAVKSHGIKKQLWFFLSICSLLYVPLSVNGIRWAPFTVILMLPGYIVLVASLLQIITRAYEGLTASLLRISLIVSSVIVFSMPTVLFEESKNKDLSTNCPLIDISEYLSDPYGLGGKPENLLAFTDFGPELLYRTPHSVFSIPSHRHHSGFTDSYHIMASASDVEAHQLITKRNINLILLCPDGHESHFYQSDSNSDTFHDRLSQQMYPAWIEQVTLTKETGKSFLLYRVIQSENITH